MRIAFSNYYCKGDRLAAALSAAGHRFVERPDQADAVFLDYDNAPGGRSQLIDEAVAVGTRVILYPHGGCTSWITGWDGLESPHPGVSEIWVNGPGHAEVMRRYGGSRKVCVIGWTFSELRPRQLRPPHRVLLAPEHPPYVDERPAVQNRAAFEALYALLERREIQHLAVRTLGSSSESAIPYKPTVEYHCLPWTVDKYGFGAFADQVREIDAFDVVVSNAGTFAALAVARGITAIIWGSDSCRLPGGAREPTHIDAYRDYIRFPWSSITLRGIAAAAADVDRVAAWRDRFIGGPLILPREWSTPIPRAPELPQALSPK